MATAPEVRWTAACRVLLPVFLGREDEDRRATPATSEPGIFWRATTSSTAASNWIGPSTLISGARSRTSRVASRTLSTSAPAPESPVE